MPTLLPWMTYKDAHKYESEAARWGVSTVARGRGGFMRIYEKHGLKMKSLPFTENTTWGRRRDNFVKRHMEQYKKNPTRRRWLALIMWAYMPPGPAPAPLSPRTTSSGKGKTRQRVSKLSPKRLVFRPSFAKSKTSVKSKKSKTMR